MGLHRKWGGGCYVAVWSGDTADRQADPEFGRICNHDLMARIYLTDSRL